MIFSFLMKQLAQEEQLVKLEPFLKASIFLTLGATLTDYCHVLFNYQMFHVKLTLILVSRLS